MIGISTSGRGRTFSTLLLVCLLALAAVAYGSKAKTEVDLQVAPQDGGSYRYTVTVKSSKAKCVEGRKVRIYHDENNNKRFDPGEYTIAKGETDADGLFESETNVIPPAGDGIGVEVKKTKKCKAGRDWGVVED